MTVTMNSDPISRLRRVADESGKRLGLVSIPVEELRALVAERRCLEGSMSQASPPPQDEVEPLDWLANNISLQLSYGPVDGDLSECAWQVYSVNGGHNDREWTLVATGSTPLIALQSSRAALTAMKGTGDE